MIFVSQNCVNPEFVPLGFVMVSAHFDTSKRQVEAIRDLMAKLQKEAPKGATHLFNFVFEFQPGLVSTAYADAYSDGKPQFVPRGTNTQDGVPNVDATLQGSPHHYA